MKESEELQNMVLGILAPKEEESNKETTSLLEILETHYPEPEVLSRSRETVSLIEADPNKQNVLDLTSELAAAINRTTTGHYRQSAPGYQLSLLLLDYIRERAELTEVTTWITRYADELELKLITRDSRRRIAYLEDYWKEETAAQLADILQTKKPTVERWLDGSNPSSGNSNGMNQIVTILFRLNKRAGMSEQKALEWFNSHNGNLGDSPRNVVKNGSHWGMTQDLQKELRRVGAYD